jgi:lipid-A-disaccharide synthase
LSYLIARRLVKVPFIAMVNLICGKEVVKELIQDDFNPQQLKRALHAILEDEKRNAILKEYAVLRERLDTGDPAQQVAEHIVSAISTR